VLRLSILFCAAVLVGTPGCQNPSSAASNPRAPDGEAWLSPAQLGNGRILTAPVVDEDVGGAVVTSGRISFDDLRVAHVFSPVTGRIVRIAAHPGEHVKKGALLAVIESPDVGAAFADLAKATADLVAADKDYERQRSLFAAHAASEKDYETALDTRERANAEVARAEKRARLLRRGGAADAVTQEYRLTAPIDGEVVMRALSPGMEVVGQYSQGNAAELFTIGALDRVWLLSDLFEIDLGRVKPGAQVSARVVSYAGRIFAGDVDWVSSQLDPSTRAAKVRCVLDNPERLLKPEMYATVSIAAGERRALAIPRSALLRLGDQTVVFVEAGVTPTGLVRFERRPVAVDEDEGGDYLPVTQGLSRGERIVTQGVAQLAGMM
jgi:membrane fusion protein, heavy metal efflux system